MIKGDYDYLKNLAKINVCSEHKTPLEVAWYGQEKTWVLRCDEGSHIIIESGQPGESHIANEHAPGHYPDAITRQPSLTGLYKQGEELPGHIEDNIKKRQRREAMQQGKQPTAVTMGGVSAVDLGTGELLVPEVIKALVDYAYKYHLDPARGHVVLMYSKPYITLDGYLYHANQVNMPYKMESHPLTDEERKTYQVPEGAHAWLTKIDKGWSHSQFTGLGIVTQEEMTATSPRDESKLRSPVVAKHPWQLAQKRAEWQALRRAFPIGESEEDKEGYLVNA